MKPFLPFFLLLLALSSFHACSHYQLGSASTNPITSLYLEPSINRSFAPQVLATFENDLRQELIRQGIALSQTPEQASHRLRVLLTEYNKEVVANTDQDTALANAYDLILAAQITLTDQADQRPLIDNRILQSRKTSFILDNNLARAQIQDMPILTRTLAENIVESLRSTW